jgi:MoaA/NifB/PqqE/SkfB family radical SAM enzyme
MKIPHDKFCILPWISLEASPVGTVRPCCLAKNEIVDNEGVKFTLGKSALDTIRHSEYMTNLRRAFLRGDLPTDCDRCWNEERSGRTSKRMHTLERLKHIVTDRDWDENVKPLMFLDLKLGNICNLKCRICGSWSSSTFAAEEIRYQADKKDNFHYVMMKLGRWPREKQLFWQDLEQHMSGLRYLEFTGGEPFMISEHFELLQKLVDRGHASNIEIHYNTNGTIYPVGAEEIWRNFRHVEIAFSIDDVGERFEYQRSGAEWSMVNAHIEQFREMRNRNSNISLQVCTTVNVLNVAYLGEVASWIDQQDFDFIYWNMLHDSPEFCIANLPNDAKHHITNKLRASAFSDKHRNEIDKIIEFMINGPGNDGKELKRKIKEIDLRRNQNLFTVAPELARIIKYES